MMKNFLISGLLALTTLAACAGLPTLELAVGMYRLRAEVAHTDQARMTGLMNRSEMPADAGMLFVFPQAKKHCMWMRNTLIPLSVAFIDEQGRILNIEDMQPQTETHHCSQGQARYALETNLGWFSTRKLAAGSPVAGLERAPAPK